MDEDVPKLGFSSLADSTSRTDPDSSPIAINEFPRVNKSARFPAKHSSNRRTVTSLNGKRQRRAAIGRVDSM